MSTPKKKKRRAPRKPREEVPIDWDKVVIPTTPMRIFRRKRSAPREAFFVLPEYPATGKGSRPKVSDEEVSVLAQIIYNAYLEDLEKKAKEAQKPKETNPEDSPPTDLDA